MRHRRRLRRWILAAAVILVAECLGYVGYIGAERSRLLVLPERNSDCSTPRAQYGWAYEPINYDARADASGCVDSAVRPGDELVAADGVRLAGWYIPAADGGGPHGPTIVVVHGHGSDKSAMLPWVRPLHARYNVVAFDLRNSGQSDGDMTTMGILERDDLRAVIDWLEREKAPTWTGLFGESMGAVTAVQEAVGDPRIDAVAIDSMYAHLASSISSRIERRGQPRNPATWAILTAARIRTGIDLEGGDPLDVVAGLGNRPLLITHGSGDGLARPAESAELIYAAAQAAGVPVRLQYCRHSGHGRVVQDYPQEWAGWISAFFDHALASG